MTWVLHKTFVVCDLFTCHKIGTLDNYKRCGSCKYNYYCSKECQVNHWCDHKSVCKHLCEYKYGDVINKVIETINKDTKDYTDKLVFVNYNSMDDIELKSMDFIEVRNRFITTEIMAFGGISFTRKIGNYLVDNSIREFVIICARGSKSILVKST